MSSNHTLMMATDTYQSYIWVLVNIKTWLAAEACNMVSSFYN